MAKRKGKVAQQTSVESTEKPYSWEDYGDGSGHMVTDMGHTLFEYDERTNEVRDPYARRYVPMNHDGDKSWREQCESMYMESLRPEEIKAAEMAKHGIYYPTYPDIQADRNKCEEVFITDGVLLPMDDFKKLWGDMRSAQIESMGEMDLKEYEVANKIRHGLQEPDDRGIGCKFHYEGKDFTIQADTFEQVPMDADVLRANGMPVPGELQSSGDEMEF